MKSLELYNHLPRLRRWFGLRLLDIAVEERLDFIETRRRADVGKQIRNVVLLTRTKALDQAIQNLSVILETVDFSLQIELSALVAFDIDDAFLFRLDTRFAWGYTTTLQPLSRAATT